MPQHSTSSTLSGSPAPVPTPKIDPQPSSQTNPFQEELISAFGRTFTSKLSKVMASVRDSGLALQDACALHSLNFKELTKYMNEFPPLRTHLERMELKFKADLLTSVTSKARRGDSKMAQWLLERKFKEEYGPRQDRLTKEDEDVFTIAIAQIRKEADAPQQSGKGTTPSPSNGLIDPNSSSPVGHTSSSSASKRSYRPEDESRDALSVLEGILASAEEESASLAPEENDVATNEDEQDIDDALEEDDKL